MTASSGDHPAKDLSTNGHATSNGPQRGHTTTPFRSDRSLAEELAMVIVIGLHIIGQCYRHLLSPVHTTAP
jgi:hypothetical protein